MDTILFQGTVLSTGLCAFLGLLVFASIYVTTSTYQLDKGLWSAGNRVSDQESVQKLLAGRRESISGVSLDEEMINLVKFQTAYDAAAKLIATADELMQTVLNLV